MRRFLAAAIFSIFFISCDDGDIIVSNFDFNNEDLAYCEIGNTRVLYKIDNENLETLSLSFTNINFTGTTANIDTSTVTDFVLSNSNRILYRSFNGTIPNNYFCTSIPPTEPLVTEEYYSTGGVVVFTTEIVSQDDNDGVPEEDEDIDEDGDPFNDDTDSDGIPNFLDLDDDGDGILTMIEIINPDPNSEEYPDTDEDGIPDYLDPDDDGDGVPTINEDADGDGDPRNDDANENDIADYLDPLVSEVYEAYEVPLNQIPRRFRTVVRITNMTLSNGNETITEANTFEFGVYDTGTIPYIIEAEEAED